jgi:hypothetical protein
LFVGSEEIEREKRSTYKFLITRMGIAGSKMILK